MEGWYLLCSFVSAANATLHTYTLHTYTLHQNRHFDRKCQQNTSDYWQIQPFMALSSYLEIFHDVEELIVNFRLVTELDLHLIICEVHMDMVRAI